MNGNLRSTLDLEEVRHKVLTENTGQTVFKHLRDLANKRRLVLSRWAWELLQNARDAAREDNSVAVRIRLSDGTLSFAHDGRPFSLEEITHLIYHGSTKQSDSGSVGQFGTGFISTHLISPTVQIRGRLDTGQRFDFVLSRAGASANEISEAMEESFESFRRSIGDDGREDDVRTEFTYPVRDELAQELISAGVDSLRRGAPLVLAFNPTLSSLSIELPDSSHEWSRGQRVEEWDHISLLEIERRSSTSDAEVELVAMATLEGVTAASLLVRDQHGYTARSLVGLPRLFLAFPLLNTETFSFPAAINAEGFAPTEQRDGIHLGTSESSDNEHNQACLERASDLYLELVETAVNAGWRDIHQLVTIPQITPREWLDSEWLTELLRNRIVRRLDPMPIVPVLSGKLVATTSAWIPVGEHAKRTWALTSRLTEAVDKLPPESLLNEWSECFESWASIEEVQVEELNGAWTLHKLAERVADVGSITALQAALTARTAAVSWLSGVIEALEEADGAGVFDDLALLPNQEGAFRLRSDLLRDPGIDPELKALCEELGVPISGRLLHQGIESQGLIETLGTLDPSEIIGQALMRIRELGRQVPWPTEYESANVTLFRWLVMHDMLQHLNGYSIMSADPTHAITFVSEECDDTPLGPVGVWPKAAREFSELFPRRHVVAALYFDACPDRQMWQKMRDAGYVRLEPLYSRAERVACFLPDDPPEEVEHRAMEEQRQVRIAFLSHQDGGIINTVRKSRGKALQLLRFLESYALSTKPDPLRIVSAECECGNRHRFFQGEWLEHIRRRQWVPSARRSLLANAESIADLLRERDDREPIITHSQSARLFQALGISLADVTLRTMVSSEEDRGAVSSAFVSIIQVAGNRPERVQLLAEEIRANPKFFDDLVAQREIRERIHRNQDIGSLVETLLRELLGQAGARVTRTGVGSDFEVENDVVVDNQELWLSIETPNRSVLLEVKATTTDHVRMTPKQAETACTEKSRFALCVVRVPVGGVTSEGVKKAARFVSNIGSILSPLWSQFKAVNDFKERATLRTGDLCVILAEAEARFQIGSGVWSNADPLDRFISLLARAR